MDYGGVMFSIKESEVMTKKAGFENSIIRIPRIIREHKNLVLGDFINLNGAYLQVDKAFGIDLATHSDTCFVSADTIKKMGSKVNTFEFNRHITMGCDPEVFLVDVTKNRLFNPGFLFKKWDALGYDGMLVEFRPRPDIDHKKVVENIRELIGKAQIAIESSNLNNVKLIARSSGWQLFSGFHVHMGIPGLLLNSQFHSHNKILDVIVKILDYYVGIPSVMCEGKDNSRRCAPYIKYGKVSDYRKKVNTLEYRVPGGTLLKHPYLAEGLLGISSLVIHDVINRLKLYTDNFAKKIDIETYELIDKLYPNIPESRDMFNIICAPDTSSAEKLSEKVYTDLTNMTNYGKYSDSIDRFINIQKCYISECLKTNWLVT